MTSLQGIGDGSNHHEHLRVRPDLQVRHPELPAHDSTELTFLQLCSPHQRHIPWCSSRTADVVHWYVTTSSIHCSKEAGLRPLFTGNASGRGNPYGEAAAVAVLSIPIVFLRVFAPFQYLPGAFLFGVRFLPRPSAPCSEN